MKKRVVESEIYEAALDVTGDEYVAFDLMSFATDTKEEVSVWFDDETGLFKLHGDIRTEWTDCRNCCDILNALNNGVWNLPQIGTDDVISYSSSITNLIAMVRR